MVNDKIKIPYTKAELAQSHSFKAFIYPQILNSNAFLGTLFTSIKYDNLIAGITKVSKTITKTIESRRKMGRFEVYQNVPVQLSYSLSLDKVVFYKDNNNELNKYIQVEKNGFIKQFFPFIIQETAITPEGIVKDTTLWLDCWFNEEKVTLDLDSDNYLVTKDLSVTVGAMINKDDNIDISEALEFTQSFYKTSVAVSNFIIDNINIKL